MSQRQLAKKTGLTQHFVCEPPVEPLPYQLGVFHTSCKPVKPVQAARVNSCLSAEMAENLPNRRETDDAFDAGIGDTVANPHSHGHNAAEVTLRPPLVSNAYYLAQSDP